ncbi:MAG: hypothetical protein H7839_17910 [Magnetococcus sp. YQC-5]
MNKLMTGMAVMAWMTVMPAWAADTTPEKTTPEKDTSVVTDGQFKDHKTKMIQQLEEKLTCLKAANSKEDIKHCNEAQKVQNQKEKLQRIQERKKKLESEEKILKEKLQQ